MPFIDTDGVGGACSVEWLCLIVYIRDDFEVEYGMENKWSI